MNVALGTASKPAFYVKRIVFITRLTTIFTRFATFWFLHDDLDLALSKPAKLPPVPLRWAPLLFRAWQR